ncbi:MAG: RNA 2',3'-cyclic phosphodiesterase [Geobacteraceae bacterium]|nr:RNA 2',3'-cyclic phosphodiesterase [Geobacteraceae bacterium]
MRSFIAIELPPEIKKALNALRSEIAGVHWLPPEQLHLTLLFLGDIAADQLEQLSHCLLLVKAAPFRLRVTSTGCFPNPRSPRVLWVGLQRQTALERLAAQVRSAATSCGIVPEKRPFSPHITMARIKRPEPCDISSYLNQCLHKKIPEFNVQGFVLCHSTLTQQGAVHQPLSLFPCTDTTPSPVPS